PASTPRTRPDPAGYQKDSVDEDNVAHRGGLVLGVHVDAVPPVQLDGLVVGVADGAANVQFRIHGPGDEWQPGGAVVVPHEGPVLVLPHPGGKPSADLVGQSG